MVVLGVLVGGVGQARADYIYTSIDIGDYTEALGINNAGEIVGTFSLETGRIGPQQYGFLLSGGAATPLVPSMSAFGEGTVASGINNSSHVVGYLDRGLNHQGFLLSIGGYTFFAVPGSVSTQAQGIGDAGQIVGLYNSDRQHGFLLSGGTYSTLDVPGSISTGASGINSSSQIVGGFSDASGKNHGFLLSGGTYTTLDLPGAYSTTANGINGAGQIVGTYDDKFGFLFSNGNYTTLDFPGSAFTFAEGINDLGDIVGYYTNSSGSTFGFLAVPEPVPEPATLLLAGIGGLGTLGWAWRKRYSGR